MVKYQSTSPDLFWGHDHAIAGKGVKNDRLIIKRGENLLSKNRLSLTSGVDFAVF
jgi:hypothetical protein